jgi:DNA-damage-inducible protein D
MVGKSKLLARDGEEYAILTNLIHQEWSRVSVKAHKELKGIETQNLRDHMSEAEFIFTALAELSTRQIAETTAATGLTENKSAAKTGARLPKVPAWNSKTKLANPS